MTDQAIINVECINDEQLLGELRKFVLAHKTQRAAAAALSTPEKNVSHQHINDMLCGRAPVSESVAGALGWIPMPRAWVRKEGKE